MRCRDQQHIGSVDGERATTHRTGNDACQVEYLDARKGAVARGQGLRRCMANLIDGEEWEASDRTALWMLIPLGERPACGNHEAGVGGGRLERLTVPSVKCALYCPWVVTAAEQREHPVAVMGQIGMQPHPTTDTVPLSGHDTQAEACHRRASTVRCGIRSRRCECRR